jgi:hypothetical protein
MAPLRLMLVALLASAALLAPGAARASLDHGHAAFDGLLRRHVAWDAAGVATRVSYAGLAAERAELRRVLDGYTAVGRDEYDTMTRDQRLAFLINAYNAWTLELILTRYPDLGSIRDLGSLIQSPWRRRFFTLLGERRGLDDVEHGMIRAPGAFDEPRSHFVVNCASIGCPALRPEAITEARLEAQLEDSTRRFLRDASRNRYDPAHRRLEVSRIFDWYGGDFSTGPKGAGSLERFFARYADLLASDPGDRAVVREGRARIAFLDYDWALNDRR